MSDDELVHVLQKLNRDLQQQNDTLTEALDRLRAEHLKLRGRVYALWGAGKDPDEPQETSSLTDPRLTKAQIRAALIARGQLRPQQQ